jgi:hypothetical protein
MMDAHEFAETVIGGMHLLSLEVTTFKGTKPKARASTGVTSEDCEHLLPVCDSKWRIAFTAAPSKEKPGLWECAATFTVVEGGLPNANAAVNIDFDKWSTDNHVLIPAAAYNGNRYRSLPKRYPPMLHADDGIGPAMPVTMTDVPRLAVDDAEAESVLHLRSGDMATPCVGIHFPGRDAGLLLLAEHDTSVGYTGLMLEESETRTTARLRLEAPAVRPVMYLHCNTHVPSDDRGHDFRTGDSVTLRFNLHVFPCADIPALYKRFFERRQELSAPPALPNVLPFSQAFRVIEDKFIGHQWNAKQELIRVDVTEKDGDSRFGDWQAGWVGGGMSTLAFLSDGQPVSRERSRKTMDTIFSPRLQAPNGWIYGIMHRGVLYGDDFCHQEKKDILLIRKDADVLLFAARHVLLLRKRGETVPEGWLSGLRRLADAFVRLWEKHGQFGQFIDIATDGIVMGNTASGSSAPGGLALAWLILKDARYRDVAAASARLYHETYVRAGLLNGGPGEILQCPDSESAFNMLESLVVLYETTKDRAWLEPAEECARICASWCMSYDFHFPPGSEFSRLDIRCAGSVFANAQNKHSAPAICTLSGASLLRLYRATGDAGYLRLCREITHGLPQYVSRADRPIRDFEGRVLPPGWICERVNTCDWETKRCVGGVFYGSNWPEVSCLLTWTEVPGVWLLTDTGEVTVFDHVEAAVSDAQGSWRLTLANPTPFDAEVKVLAEPRSAFSVPWGECVLEGCPVLRVPANGRAEMTIPKHA